jgi:integrase
MAHLQRSLPTLLMTKGEGVKVVQELMRHANSTITLDISARGDEVAERAAALFLKKTS